MTCINNICTKDLTLSPEDVQRLAPSICDQLRGQHLSHGNFSALDLKRLNIGFFDFNRVTPLFRMSEYVSGEYFKDPEGTKGWACFESLGEVENRRLADWLEDNCEKVLGEGSKENCESLTEIVDHYAQEDPYTKFFKGAGEAIIRGLETFIIFGPALYGFGKWIGKRNGGGGGKGDANGGGVSGHGTSALGVKSHAVATMGIATFLAACVAAVYLRTPAAIGTVNGVTPLPILRPDNGRPFESI